MEIEADESFYYASDGARLAFRDQGPRGDIPLLFVHGWLAAAGIWEPLIGKLGPRHRVVTVDLRGFGDSNAAPGPYSLDRFAGDLRDLIAAIDLDPPVVVGHSMGAAIAQRFAIDNPDAVEGLILMAAVPASGVPFPPKVLDFFRSLAGHPERAAQWFDGLTFGEASPEIKKLLHEAHAKVSPEAALESLVAWQQADFAGEAATIETPTLVLAPAGDRPMTPDFLRANVADLIAGSTFEIIEESAHYLPLERPTELAARIERFVENL
jgi:pimeloyl-ACP methyl ester carboxylesterase